MYIKMRYICKLGSGH